MPQRKRLTNSRPGPKPQTASGYPGDQVERAARTCLQLATRLGDFLEQDVVLVGGYVPSLLIPQAGRGQLGLLDRHVGTLDLDLALQVGLLDSGRYEALIERLRAGGFVPDTTAAGNVTRQRWRSSHGGGIEVDFLIPPSVPDDRPGTLRNIRPELAAFIMPGLELAFADRERVALTGRTLQDEPTTREIPVCGPASFVVLKALALKNRGAEKDAYDLAYVIRNFGRSPAEVAARFQRLPAHAKVDEALAYLREEFQDPDALGPRRFARFVTGATDATLQADAAGLVRDLLARIRPDLR